MQTTSSGPDPNLMNLNFGFNNNVKHFHDTCTRLYMQYVIEADCTNSKITQFANVSYRYSSYMYVHVGLGKYNMSIPTAQKWHSDNQLGCDYFQDKQ